MSFFKTPLGRVAAVVLAILIVALIVMLVRGVETTSKGPGTGDARPTPELRAHAYAPAGAPTATRAA